MMKPIKAQDAAIAAGGTCVNGEETYIRDVSIDSREDLDGKAFFAICGENFDGHAFVMQAFDKNCALAVVNLTYQIPERLAERCFIRVADTTKALQDIARYYLSTRPVLRVAVTGSVGKTTTREMLHAVFQRKYRTLQNIKNFNNGIGVPLTIFKIEEEHEVVIFEMGMNHEGEIRLLVDLVRPQIAVITNVGTAHIENLGSRENILKAKWEITSFLQNDNTLVINSDDEWLMKKSQKQVGFSILRAGKDTESHFHIRAVENKGAEGILFTLTSDKQEQEFRLSTPGVHNAFNASLAVAAGSAAGISMQEAAEGLLSVKNQAGRLHIKKGKNDTIVIDDTYNANPDSARAALHMLSSMSGSRKVAILGDMLELGDFAGEGHRMTGSVAAELGIDVLLAVGAHAESLCVGARQQDTKIKTVNFCDKQTLIETIGQYVLPSDTILVKGSRGMKMEKIVEHLTEE